MDIPVSEENGFIVNLNWTIPAGEYIITTDSDLNNSNFEITIQCQTNYWWPTTFPYYR